MNSENILAVNIPNTISIVVMAVVGGAILALVHKYAASRSAANQA